MATETRTPPAEGPPEPGPVLSPRAIVRRRRRDSRRRLWAQFKRNRLGMAGLIILIVFVLIAVLAPLLVSSCYLDPTCPATGPALHPPTWNYPFWFGTDKLGRPVLALTIYGARVSLLVGFLGTFMTMVIGSAIGLIAGYYGGMRETVLMRITDWFLVLPFLPLAIVLAALLGPSFLTIIFVLAVTSWPSTARIIRAEVLSLKTRGYVERSRALGARDRSLVVRHILPNVGPLIFANTILIVAVVILSESTLSFLGLGDPLHASWGKLLEDAFGGGATFAGNWWWIFPPGLCIVLVVLAFTMIGQALDDILNPKLRSR
jgi:peptide/nickel transport system permease protein